MNYELKSILKYLKNKNNTRRIKTITIGEAHKVVEEIERLNNIINEFNKLIENEINESKLEEDYDRVDAMEYCLATLRELKGSDKE